MSIFTLKNKDLLILIDLSVLLQKIMLNSILLILLSYLIVLSQKSSPDIITWIHFCDAVHCRPPAAKTNNQQERTQRRLEQMMDTNGLQKYKAEYVNVITLRFHKTSKERQV